MTSASQHSAAEGPSRPVTYSVRGLTWLPLAALALLPVVLFRESLLGITGFWELEEYSHGYLIPFITAFMLWQRRHALPAEPYAGSWWGPVLAVLGLTGYVVGQLSAITSVDLYSIWIVGAGLVLSVLGPRGFRIVLPALFLLVLAIPLPNFFYSGLSSQLQLVSSEIGVAVIRAFGISVHLEGNVIDLGNYKLQVVEACSGLRYLFPLMTLGYIAVCFFRAPLWMRLVLFASTVPVTVLMNSFRIGVIGILVDRHGIAQAEGFLHDFEGWVVFMACLVVLFAEMWLLVRLSGDRRPLRDVFVLEFDAVSAPANAEPRAHPVPRSAWLALVLMVIAAVPVAALPSRQEVVPERLDFAVFPTRIGDWLGKRERLEAIYLDTLKLDDYELANFVREGSAPVNFYTAYYASQRSGRSAHSPRSCLPGGGWRMEQFGQHAVAGVEIGGETLVVNRTVIRHGENAQLVYYWFQQRGRIVTNEYLVKWHIFVDSLLRNRTDGALVRLVTPLAPGEDVELADRRLSEFAAKVSALLPAYVPN